MPEATVGDQRWTQAGTNSAGDRMFKRIRSGVDYEGLTKDELQDELEKRDLPKTGNKDELIARLSESDV